METADQHEVGVREALEEVQAACRELARLKEVDEIAELAMTHALALTRSSVAFMGLTGGAGSYERVYSRSADESRISAADEAERLIAGEISSSNPAVSARLLEAAGENVGMIGVARELPYTQVHRNVLAILANQVAASVQVALMRGRRQEMVDTLINLRSDLERTEKERLISAERAESAVRVERAHELAVEALLAISVHARSGYDLTEFYRRLGESVAGPGRGGESSLLAGERERHPERGSRWLRGRRRRTSRACEPWRAVLIAVTCKATSCTGTTSTSRPKATGRRKPKQCLAPSA